MEFFESLSGWEKFWIVVAGLSFYLPIAAAGREAKRAADALEAIKQRLDDIASDTINLRK